MSAIENFATTIGHWPRLATTHDNARLGLKKMEEPAAGLKQQKPADRDHERTGARADRWRNAKRHLRTQREPPSKSSSTDTCSEPRVALNRTVVLRYRSHLESRQLAPGTINLRLGAVRCLAYEAAECGLLSAVSVVPLREGGAVQVLGKAIAS